MKPIGPLTLFSGQVPPWSLSDLDANTSALQGAINDFQTYSNYLIDTGVANAITVTIPPNATFALQAGVQIQVKMSAANTGGVILNVVAFAADTVLNQDGSTLEAGQLQAGGIYGFAFDGGNWQLLGASGVASAAGSYVPAFQSGNVQVCGPGNTLAGYGDFIFGFQLPNASGIPSVGVLLGGAGKSQVVWVTDEQLPGQKGITVIREAGDVSSTTPGTNDGGDLLDFAGASVNGVGGTAKYQGGTSVNGTGGPAILHGGNSTNGAPGNAIMEAGETGTSGGSCQYIATKPPASATYGVHRFQFNSIFTFEFAYQGTFFIYTDPSGYGLPGQPLVSGGPNGSVKYQTGFTGSRVIGGSTYTWSSGILISVVP